MWRFMSTLIAVSALDGCFNGDIIMLMLHTVKSVLYVYTVHLFLIYVCIHYIHFVWKKACLINQQMINIFKLILNTHVYNIMLDILTCICVAYNYQRD